MEYRLSPMISLILYNQTCIYHSVNEANFDKVRNILYSSRSCFTPVTDSLIE